MLMSLFMSLIFSQNKQKKKFSSDIDTHELIEILFIANDIITKSFLLRRIIFEL